MAKLQISSFTLICLMFCMMGTIDSAVTTGYFYDRPYNLPSFSTLRSTGQYSNIPYGQKVESSTQKRLQVPPIPSLPPLTTYIPPTRTTNNYQSGYGRVQTSTPISYTTRPVQQQQQRFQQQPQTTQYQGQQQQNVQFQQVSQPNPYPKQVNTQYTNSQEYSNTPLQYTNRPTTQFFQTTTPALQVQNQTPQPSQPPQQQQQQQQQFITNSAGANPTTSTINSNSNPLQTVAGFPDIYIVDGRQLKQYKVYEHIDNDIDQEVHNFLPANFLLNSYHSMIGDTHPLGEDLQVENRASSFQQRSQKIQQPTPNTIALGSGGLGFVKLPNGSVYLGSGSLGYISNLQHSQDVQELRSRTSSSGPDALHFGHGPLSDSFYYGNQKD